MEESTIEVYVHAQVCVGLSPVETEAMELHSFTHIKCWQSIW